MKREIPLFVLDKTRSHKLGECDFIVCTDVDNGFVAKIDYIEEEKEYSSDMLRIGYPNEGYSIRLEVKRIFGKNPVDSERRTLLKKAMEYAVINLSAKIKVKDPSYADCIRFLDILIRGNKHLVAEASGDYRKMETVKSSIEMLKHIRDILEDVESSPSIGLN